MKHFGELLETEEKQTLGMLSKMLIDHARLLWLRAQGWQVKHAHCMHMYIYMNACTHACVHHASYPQPLPQPSSNTQSCPSQAELVLYATQQVTGENRLLMGWREQPAGAMQ